MGIHKNLGVKNIIVKLPNCNKNNIDIFKSGILECSNVEEKYYITDEEQKVLSCWDEFIKGVDEKVIGFPIWASEFKSKYNIMKNKLRYPNWKVEFIEKNRNLYKNNKNFIDSWLNRWDNLKSFTPTQKKLEWQCGNYCSSIWDGIIQFRPSGIRVKRPNVFPALVAMVQIPIIGKYKRRLVPREVARLQSFPDTFIINENDHQAYKQFGNAVNVEVVRYLAKQLLSY